jgi:hypothetical protein
MAVVVVATGNHYWADGAVSVLLLGLAWASVRAAAAVRRRQGVPDVAPRPVGLPEAALDG